MRAVTNRYSLHPISGSLCGNTKDFTSPLGIRREAGVRPGANPYLSAIASPDADSFNCSGSKSRPSLMTRQTFPSLRIVRKRIGIKWNQTATLFSWIVPKSSAPTAANAPPR